VAAIIHHGGIGTSIAALRAGVPQLVLGVGGDRPENAARLAELGVAAYLPRPRWTPDAMAEALRELLGSERVRAACRAVAPRVTDGRAAAAACIEALLQARSTRLPVRVSAGDAEPSATATAASADHPWAAAGPCPLHERFEAQASRTPEATAIIFGRKRTRYRDLDTQANRLAHHLRALGVGRESRVALCLDRSVEMIVAIFAVLKAGAAYVPLDPKYPPDRLEFMARDSGARIAVTTTDRAHVFAELIPAVVRLDADADAAAIGAQPAACPRVPTSLDGLAYVIYTSGSTGTPKGTLVTHRNVARLFTATEQWFGLGPADTFSLFHSYAFDVSVFEIFGALLYGARVVVVPHAVSRSPKEFHELACRERVTVLSQTPSAFTQFMRADEEAVRGDPDLALRLVIFAGEALEIGGLATWFARHGDRKPTLVNMYGITETTVHVTYRPLVRADVERRGSAIGRPIPDLQLYLLHPDGHLVGDGVPGELYVGGSGVSRGYLDRPALTAQRFVPDPFGGPGQRLYRSGDLAQLRDGADMDYLGRIDLQVKIRGFRIELGEIEAALVRTGWVRQAVAIVHEHRGDKRIVAYVLGYGAASTAPLREALSLSLPDYMIPSVFVPMAAFPLTPTGKVDRRALPAPVAPTARPIDASLEGPIERAVGAIWHDVLSTEGPITRDADFFLLGGHSILAVEMLARAGTLFGVEVPFELLFSTEATIRGVARSIVGAIAAGVDEETLERVLAWVSGLSEEEARALVEERSTRRPPG
jgi:amino acid adenylation domain-containing protein